MQRKAQIRIAESMAVVIIFFLLVLFGYSFYLRIQREQFYQTVRENSESEAVQIAQKIYFLPEIQHSRGFRLGRESCFDQYKVEVFSELMNNDIQMRDYYWDILGTSKIEYYRVYPSSDDEPEYALYDSSELAEEQSMESQEVIHMPVSIYNPKSKDYEFGYLKVTIFYRSGVET